MAIIDPKQHLKELRSVGDKVADTVTSAIGSWPFIIIQTTLLAAWVVLNVLAVINHWDPYPFILLNLMLSFQAAYTGPIVMMSQNRAGEKSEVRAQLDYETNLQAERENAIIMQTLARIADKQGIDVSDLQTQMESLKQHAKRDADRRTEARTKRQRAEAESAKTAS